MKMISYLLTILLCASLHSCSDDNNDGGDGGETPAGTTLVKPKLDKSSVLRNPLNGWVMYASASADESYWDTEFYVTNLGKKVKPIDYASACYIRTNWATMNPSDGVYAWRDPNSKVAKMLSMLISK